MTGAENGTPVEEGKQPNEDSTSGGSTNNHRNLWQLIKSNAPGFGPIAATVLAIVAVITIVADRCGSDDDAEIRGLTATAAAVETVTAEEAAIRRLTATAGAAETVTANEAAIRRLITTEASVAIAHDAKLALSIYKEDATVRDALAEQRQALGLLPPGIKTSWHGHDEIGPRYAQLPVFPSLTHIAISMTFDSGGASATSSTSGEVVLPDGSIIPISSVDGDLWRFKKIDGEWKITSFTYNATLPLDAGLPIP